LLGWLLLFYYYWNGAHREWWDGMSWRTVSNVATGALDAARGSLPVMILGGLALVGTAGKAFRRDWMRS
jgi:hypothetical protein